MCELRDVGKKLPPEISEQLRLLAERIGPIRMPVHAYIAGGTAVTYHTASRMSDDVDIQWSARLAIPLDLQVFPVANPADPEDVTMVSMDGSFGDYWGSFNADWKADAPEIERHGDIIIHMITALDLAVSKIGRFSERDREDIEALARQGPTGRSPDPSWGEVDACRQLGYAADLVRASAPEGRDFLLAYAKQARTLTRDIPAPAGFRAQDPVHGAWLARWPLDARKLKTELPLHILRKRNPVKTA